MAVKAFNINQTRTYSLKRDKGPQKTIFHLGVLDSALSTYLFDMLVAWRRPAGEDPETRGSFVTMNKFQRDREVVKFGLKGWENFQDEGGNLIEFSQKEHTQSYPVPNVGNRHGLTPRALDLLKPYLTELAEEIEQDNLLTGEDEKNSGGPSADS